MKMLSFGKAYPNWNLHRSRVGFKFGLQVPQLDLGSQLISSYVPQPGLSDNDRKDCMDLLVDAVQNIYNGKSTIFGGDLKRT